MVFQKYLDDKNLDYKNDSQDRIFLLQVSWQFFMIEESILTYPVHFENDWIIMIVFYL